MDNAGGTQQKRSYGPHGRAMVREAVRLCTRESVALHLGVSPTTISDWCHGIQHVPFDAVLNLDGLLTTAEERASIVALLGEPLGRLGFAAAEPLDISLALRRPA